MSARAVATLALFAAGCGLTVDAAYLLGSGKAHTATAESSPTEQIVERREVDGQVAGDGGIELACFERSRAIERRWTVHRSYRRQGSYDRVAYSAALFGDVIVGGLTAGLIASKCLSDDSDLSCKNLWFAAPFAVDAVYTLIRRATVKPKILIGKHEGPASLGIAPTAASETATSCGELASAWIGWVDGPTDHAILVGEDDGRQRQLRAGALPLELAARRVEPEDLPTAEPVEADDDGGGHERIWLTGQAAALWIASPSAGIWVIGTDGVPRGVAVNRCDVLRPLAAALEPTQLETLDKECPLPEPER
jgi:hypothetical protein